MSDFWQVFGVGALDIWDLNYFDFMGMTQQVDEMRRREVKRNG